MKCLDKVSFLIRLRMVRCISNVKLDAGAMKPLRSKKMRAGGHQKESFVDFCRVKAFGGTGGNGMQTFLHLKGFEMGGPSGGDGGNGGHVIFEADNGVRSLANVKAMYKAADGGKGQSSDCFGKDGEHALVKVPCGTIVKDANGDVLADLKIGGDSFLAARGGAGGRGNHYFLSNENKCPQISEEGAEGETFVYYLELQTIAHAGLIGFPNAGKSTLLRAISRARPKVAPYPFTTLGPHVGIVHYADYEQLAVADIPGLIPGAHLNRGLGISFLRHIERCLCLLYVIDLSQPQPWQQLDSLREELEHYQIGLSKRPHAVLGNKIDLEESQKNLPILEEKIDLPVIPISAKHGTNILQLLKFLRKFYETKGLKQKYDLD